MDLSKALFEQGNILAGACIVLIGILLWHIKQRNDQDRQDRRESREDRDRMIKVIEANTSVLKAHREAFERQAEALERQARNSEDAAKAQVAQSFAIKGLRETIHVHLLGRMVPPGEDD